MDVTDDTTMDDEYQIAWLNSLSDEQREIAAIHHQDQFESVPSYTERPNAWEKN